MHAVRIVEGKLEFLQSSAVEPGALVDQTKVFVALADPGYTQGGEGILEGGVLLCDVEDDFGPVHGVATFDDVLVSTDAVPLGHVEIPKEVSAL